MMTRRMFVPYGVFALLMLSACASGPDHFYRLHSLPATAPERRQQFSAEVSIRLNIPSMVDRNQMVLEQGGTAVQILEHERWATPLADQLLTVLGQDIEYRRPSVLVTTRPVSQSAGTPRYSIEIDIVALSLQRSSGAQMEVRWRIISPGGVAPTSGRDKLAATAEDATSAALANALSDCVSQLAERLAPLLGADPLS